MKSVYRVEATLLGPAFLWASWGCSDRGSWRIHRSDRGGKTGSPKALLGRGAEMEKRQRWGLLGLK